MASGFAGIGAAVRNQPGAAPTGAPGPAPPPTGGPVALASGGVSAPAPAPAPAQLGFGGGGFTPVQGAGFGISGAPSGGGGFGLGSGVQPPNNPPAGFTGLPPGSSITPDQLFGLTTGFGGGATGQRPIPPQQFLGTGQGGFSASPRVLTGGEVSSINRELGIQGTTQQFNPDAFRARQQLGPFGFIADPSTFTRNQVPFIETRLNFENLLQAQQDRAQALNLLQEQRGQIGQRPGQQEALSVARRRLAQPEPFTPEEVSQQQSAIRQRGAQGLEAAQRQQQESLARQGVRGGVTAFQEAGQRQAAGRQTSDELQRLAIEQALGRDVNEAQAVDRLRQITGEDESRTIAINNLLTELLTAQRGEFDLSALTAKERKSERGLLSKIGFF